MRDEPLVTAAFAAWLGTEGWTVAPYPADPYLDLYAERGPDRLLVEVKGRTTEPGLDVDTGYGQLLRRMVPDIAARYALVVPDTPAAVRAALRVPGPVRDLLRITLFAVTADGAVRPLR